MKKRVLTMLLALVMALGLIVPALAAEDAFEPEAPASPVEEEAAPEVPAVPGEPEEDPVPAAQEAETTAVPSAADEAMPAATVLASGNCGANGSNVKWTLTNDGTLTIYGKGAMEDYITPEGWYYTPWHEYCSNRFFEHLDPEDNEVYYPTDYMAIIKKIVVQEGITRIGTGAFTYCASVEPVSLPNSLTEIGDSAFSNCGMTSISLPSGLKTIGHNAFSSCEKLTSIAIPNGVSKIGEYTFVFCKNLKSITIPSGMKTIDGYAFVNCDSLTDVYYGGSSQQWRRMKVDSEGNGKLLNATIHYNSSGTTAHKDGWAWENNAHCFYRNGVKVMNDWVYTEGHYYWMKADGTMAWNEKVTVNGKDYYLGESGRMQTGWIKLPNGKDYYYADSSGALKKAAWQWWGNEKYWLMPDGLMARNTLASATYGSGSKIYSFSDSGKVNKGWINIGNGDYRYGNAKEDGALAQNLWVSWDKQWYWIKDNYMMARNEKLLINGSYYYFYDSGVMGKGWIAIGNGDYYYGESWGGLRKNSWVGNYYLKDNYLMARNETLLLGNTRYTFDNSGYLIKSERANRPLDNLGSVHYILQGDNQCYATAVTMAANLIVGTDKYRVDEFRSGNGLRLPNYTYKGTDGNTYKAVRDSGNPNTQINNALSAGLPIVVTVSGNKGTHYLLIVGSAYNSDLGSADYYVIDPGYVGGKFPAQEEKATYYDTTTLSAAKTFMDSIRIKDPSFRYKIQAGAYVYFQKQ